MVEFKIMELVTSRQNNTFKHIRNLITDKGYRIDNNQFWIDGVNFVYNALTHNWKISKLIYVPEKITSDFKQQVLDMVEQKRHLAFSTNLYEGIANKKDIQGIGAIVEMSYEKNTLFEGAGVVVENISNPGNLGMIMRTCVAFNIQNLYIINPAVDPFNPETVRSSMESVFSLNISVFDSFNKIFNKLNENTVYTNIGTSLQDDSISLRAYTKTYSNKENILIWFGNEAKGMSYEARSLCKELITIPMNPNVDSLNIAGSASIMLYQLIQNP